MSKTRKILVTVAALAVSVVTVVIVGAEPTGHAERCDAACRVSDAWPGLW